MRQVLFAISSLQSSKYRSIATQIDNQSYGKYKDKNIDSEEIKQFKTIMIDSYISIKNDKRVASIGSEFNKELDDIMLVFGALPDELKEIVREEINKNKSKLTKEQKAKQEEERKKYELLIEARKEGIWITEDVSRLSLSDVEALIYTRKTNKIFDNMSNKIGTTFPFGY